MSETTSRVLQLLGLLQSRRVWTGVELADRLGVTTRSVRRDVERLRDLGYPVHASKGHGGGYQLGAGAALPPLLLDPDEAVAMAVCLRLAAGGSVAGVGESALRALSKLDQVMPSRLRSQVSAVHDATVTLTPNSSDSPVEPDVLMTLARACRDREHVTASYVDRSGAATQRRLEPYQLVTTGRRWYLLAYDRDRQDWRSLRLDRMGDVRALGSTFPAREAPDAAAFVRRSISASPYRYVARVRYFAPGTRCGTALLAGFGEHRAGWARRLRRHRGRRRSRTDGAVLRDGRQRLRGSRTARGGPRRSHGGRTPAPRRESQPVMPSRSVSTRNAAAKSLSAVSARTLVPVHLFADGADTGQQRREVAVVFVERAELLGHHLRRRQHRHADGEDVEFVGRTDGRRVDRYAVEPVQHIDDEVVADAGLEQPVLRRALDRETGLLECVRCRIGIRLGDDEVHVVHGFRARRKPTGRSCRRGRTRVRSP